MKNRRSLFTGEMRSLFRCFQMDRKVSRGLVSAFLAAVHVVFLLVEAEGPETFLLGHHGGRTPSYFRGLLSPSRVKAVFLGQVQLRNIVVCEFFGSCMLISCNPEVRSSAGRRRRRRRQEEGGRISAGMTLWAAAAFSRTACFWSEISPLRLWLLGIFFNGAEAR